MRPVTYGDVLRQGEAFLAGAGIPEPEANAWYLFSFCFNMDRSCFFLRRADLADMEKKTEYHNLLAKRAERIPLEHLTRSTEFMGLPFFVNEHVLIPRQDTECLVEEVLKLCRGKRVLDLCTGSGCIGISLARLGACSEVTLSDISPEALAVAGRNVEESGVSVHLVRSDLFAQITGTFDMIVSNPPYIPTEEIRQLMPEVRDHDPHLALDGGKDGLDFYRRIIREGRAHLERDGWLCLEIGCSQADAVRNIMEQAGFSQIRVRQDLAGLDRIVMGRNGGSDV